MNEVLGSTSARPLRTLGILILCLSVFIPACADASEITIAAASDLTFAFKDVATRFEQQTGNAVKLSYGSSGNFFSQIQNGAPYDLFFSADIDYPKKLEAAGLTEAGTLYPYANGRIVLWAPDESKLDLSRGLQALLEPALRKIAIANPEHAPYGRAAVAAMRHEGIYDKVRDKLVLGENVSQAAQFVQSGNADIGIVALSLAVAPAMKARGRFVEVPAADYPAIVQAAVILKSSHEKQVAWQFLNFLKEPAVAALMQQHGFTAPQAIDLEK
ncbi:MAG: molybdate ABC transporter substrate-binding protein [Candidatus Binatus sp.]|uniref:molybdate ABC transporter substrate-binding protein n=1 Tax=Candidatus Binatus sp. TaxID=2811406 RepID=UPI0027250BFA|nr:molybdate ABC transporter substrate-binding protein [Candidatus Binatus sp.]MDO8431110.1 molybdate ABC transporter substrate-binding protein [Candidatus Binatus sp.]